MHTASVSEVLDMSEEHLAFLKGAIARAFEAPVQGASVYGELSRRIRADMDSLTGEIGWSVVVGRAWAAGVSHRSQHYACVTSLPAGVSVLAWRA